MAQSPETRELINAARSATTQLRDAARQVMGHRQRDPLVLAIHAALDRLETCDRALAASVGEQPKGEHDDISGTVRAVQCEPGRARASAPVFDVPAVGASSGRHGEAVAPVGEPAPMSPEIQVGDIVTDRLLGVVTVRELDGIGGVIVVTRDGMEAVVPVDDILSIYRDPLWWRTDRKEPTAEHRCGVRGFAESGDKCPGCVAAGRVWRTDRKEP